MEDEINDLFAIDISSDESSSATKVPRDQQTEADFLALKKTWRPKIEQGEIYKALSLPVDNPSKQQSQAILHAAEEHYFYRRYDESARIVDEALKGELSEDFRQVLQGYRDRCQSKKKSLAEKT